MLLGLDQAHWRAIRHRERSFLGDQSWRLPDEAANLGYLTSQRLAVGSDILREVAMFCNYQLKQTTRQPQIQVAKFRCCHQ